MPLVGLRKTELITNIRRTKDDKNNYYKNNCRITYINGIKQPDGTIKNLPIKQVADILGHTTTEITELYYVRRESDKLNGVTDGFEL